jgi:DNA-binding transcriptional LysR family regulator
MDTRFLETLVTVVECGSLAEAARRLNLTASAVAQRIQALETEIGIPLLARSGRTVHPTSAAVAVLERARSVQREIRDLKSVAASGILSGELRLGVVPSMLTGFLPDVLAHFSASHPQIELRIARGDSAEVYRELIEERTDVAITSEPPFAIPKTCDWSLLREEPYVVLASAMILERDPLVILRHEPFIHLHRKLHAGQAIDRYLRKKGIHPIERFELDGLGAIAIMVDRGLGVSLLPDYAPPWPEGLTLRKIPISDRSMVRRIGLLWRRASLRIGLIRAFARHAEQTAGRKARRAQRR